MFDAYTVASEAVRLENFNNQTFLRPEACGRFAVIGSEAPDCYRLYLLECNYRSDALCGRSVKETEQVDVEILLICTNLIHICANTFSGSRIPRRMCTHYTMMSFTWNLCCWSCGVRTQKSSEDQH